MDGDTNIWYNWYNAGERMKSAMKKLVRDEKGAAMVLVLILLIIGGLIAAPLLGHMGSGILAGEVHERRTAELYAADAGVEDAIWRLPELGLCPNQSTNYTIPDINGKKVEIFITNRGDGTHKITSIAVTDGDGGGGVAAIDSSTAVEAYVTAVDKSSGILDHVIVTPCDYTEEGPTEVEPPAGEEHGPEVHYAGAWPTAEMLSNLYWQDVNDALPYYDSDTLHIEDYCDSGIGPLYRDGPLDIKNTGAKNVTVKLNGTVYIELDTLIGQTNQDFTLDLNGQTIFVACADGAALEDDPCNPDSGYALKIGGKCTFIGSGCIIAVGSIDFMPNLNCSKDDYILVLSVSGKTYMHPNGDFYGTLAGNAEVEMQNGKATWTDYSTVEGGLNFPDLPGVQQVSSCSIVSWEINQL